MQQQSKQTKLWVMTALFTAITCVCTMVIAIPTPWGGYVNLGDTGVLLGAYLLGPWYGAIAGGVGSALADILLGYTIYAPATLLIKGLMAVVAGLLMGVVGKALSGRLTCGVAAELVMIVGYWLFDGLLSGNLLAGLVGIGSNGIQAVFGIAASTALVMALERSDSVTRNFVSLR
ncbi:ECF transporter S component [Bengtsoniella intestinalis]|uniref:ECF transporter S component n=1 Tax=Bengtsoniella intestinalis TaxID=3073143 RepID=UPI00391F7D01